VFWNHPGWRQPDEIPIWYDEHTELFQNGSFQGIELVNEYSYYPKAYQWALDKKLTIMGDSDVHSPIHQTYDLTQDEHRPITLVFAKEKSVQAIKEALLARRTAVYHNELLLGDEKFLQPIFNGSVEILNPKIWIKGKRSATIQIRNQSDLRFELIAEGDLTEVSVPGEITLHPERTILFQVKGKSENASGEKKILIAYRVKNLLIAPDQGLPVILNIEVNFVPEE
jgi:hypothetical protein